MFRAQVHRSGNRRFSFPRECAMCPAVRESKNGIAYCDIGHRTEENHLSVPLADLHRRILSKNAIVIHHQAGTVRISQMASKA